MLPKPSDAVIIEQNQQQQQAPPAEQTPMDDAVFEAEMKKRLGLKADEAVDFEKVKSAFNPAPAPVELTEEQKKAAEDARQKLVFDAFISNGNTVDDWTKAQTILAKDDIELGKEAAIAELVENGFTEDEAADIVKRQYFIKDGEQTLYSETELKYGEKKLLTKAEQRKAEAKAKIAEAEQLLSVHDVLQKRNAEWVEQVDKVIAEVPKIFPFNVGTKDAPQVQNFDVDTEDVAAVHEIMKDPKKARAQIYNEDGKTVNVERLTQLLIKEQLFEKVAVANYRAGNSNGIGGVQNRFLGQPTLASSASSSGVQTNPENGAKVKNQSSNPLLAGKMVVR